jgi:hypothetical protein
MLLDRGCIMGDVPAGGMANMGNAIQDMCEVLRRWAALGALVKTYSGGKASQVPDASMLRVWARLGSEFLACQRRGIPDFEAARRMIDATVAWFEFEKSQLRSLLEASNRALAPLADPLLVDFGAHRWLVDSREEAYSDWLSWIVEQLRDPELVLPLFRINNAAVCADCGRAREFIVKREKPIKGGKRRLDFIICYGDTALIVVEVKVTDADVAQTSKQSDYKKWVDKQRAPNRYSVLLATGGELNEYDGFQMLSWAELCNGLRKVAPKAYVSKSPVIAAMILAFIGAVEQNLLGFIRPDLESEAMRSTWPELAAHIRKSL